jgi:phosphoglycolate phosphatase
VAKPDPQFLCSTIARAGGTSDSAIMVGDSIMDIASARAADIPVIGVTFGYSETPVAELRPDRVISAFDDLPAAVLALTPHGT